MFYFCVFQTTHMMHPHFTQAKMYLMKSAGKPSDYPLAVTFSTNPPTASTHLPSSQTEL